MMLSLYVRAQGTDTVCTCTAMYVETVLLRRGIVGLTILVFVPCRHLWPINLVLCGNVYA